MIFEDDGQNEPLVEDDDQDSQSEYFVAMNAGINQITKSMPNIQMANHGSNFSATRGSQYGNQPHNVDPRGYNNQGFQMQNQNMNGMPSYNQRVG